MTKQYSENSNPEIVYHFTLDTACQLHWALLLLQIKSIAGVSHVFKYMLQTVDSLLQEAQVILTNITKIVFCKEYFIKLFSNNL